MNLAGHVIKSSKDLNIYQPSSHSDEYFYMPVYSLYLRVRNAKGS